MERLKFALGFMASFFIVSAIGNIIGWNLLLIISSCILMLTGICFSYSFNCERYLKTPKLKIFKNSDKWFKAVGVAFLFVVISVIWIIATESDGGGRKWSDLSNVEKENARYSHQLYEYLYD